MADQMFMWAIYDHPKDFPDDYVARKWVVQAGRYAPTKETLVGDLDTLRSAFRHMGLTAIARSAQDDPKIVETWL